MGKVLGGDRGTVAGKVGPVVYFSYNGETYVRTLPKRRRKDQWSADQTGYRQKFSKVCWFWSTQIWDATKNIWQLAAEKMNGFNLFVKTNLPAFGPDGTVTEFERFHVSTGKLPLPRQLRAERVVGDPEKVEVHWEDDSGEALALPDDELMMVAVRGSRFFAPVATGALRRQQSAVVQLPSGSGEIQGIYLYFGSAKRELYSVDQWFGL